MLYFYKLHIAPSAIISPCIKMIYKKQKKIILDRNNIRICHSNRTDVKVHSVVSVAPGRASFPLLVPCGT